MRVLNRLLLPGAFLLSVVALLTFFSLTAHAFGPPPGSAGAGSNGGPAAFSDSIWIGTVLWSE